MILEIMFPDLKVLFISFKIESIICEKGQNYYKIFIITSLYMIIYRNVFAFAYIVSNTNYPYQIKFSSKQLIPQN